MFTYKTHISFKSDTWEGQFIKVKLCNENKYICIANIYRPPKKSNSSTIIEIFIEELDPIITDLNKSNSKIVLLGDYNINLLKIKDKTVYNDFFVSLLGHNLQPVITFPTCT